MTAATAKKILLVDDDEALRLPLGEQLRLYEFKTVETGTGADALNLAKREHFDAILLDVGLPDMNGCEVCRLMRSSGVTAAEDRMRSLRPQDPHDHARRLSVGALTEIFRSDCEGGQPPWQMTLPP